jgi:methanogenic corrinoid protein MtbC1
MTTDPDDTEGQWRQMPDFAGISAFVQDRPGVEQLASEVLNLVARRATEIRRAKDRAAVMAASVALTSGNESEAAAALEALDDSAKGLDWFLSERLGPIAKQIGQLWNEDKVTFLEATVGATRIYTYIRYRRRPAVPVTRAAKRAATFVLVPGDMHTLGISAATDVFRARGWDITLLVGHSHDELVAQFETSNDINFGFSAGSTGSMAALGRLVVSLTVARPNAHVLVSGQIAAAREDVLRLPGVDACEVDLEDAHRWLSAQYAEAQA